ncbi:hypothetical protein TWF718_003647 [Orbilia javanica]|uniref:Uncharacterized protein n=1 Tax=Orbilia javanica TaxID=47235 RepID=A0AAN8RF10_9PEZI
MGINRGINGIHRSGMANHPVQLRPVPPPPRTLPPHHRLNSLQPRRLEGGPRLQRTPLRTMPPAPIQVGEPVVQRSALNHVPDLRFQISEGSSSESESTGASPNTMSGMRVPSPPPAPLRVPVDPPMSPQVAFPPGTIIPPIEANPRNVVTRQEFEDVIDDLEGFVGDQLEGMRTKIGRELGEERRQRELETFESNVIHEEITDELDEERRERHLQALGSNLRQQVMKEDIEELKERTTNLEYENQRTKDTLISIATRQKTPPPQVVINNTCTHRPNSRSGLDDSSSSGSGLGEPIRPIGPGPPSSSSCTDDYLSAGPDPTGLESPHHTPNPLSFRVPRANSPLSGLGVVVPEGSFDEGGIGFQVPASPRTTVQPRPIRRASIDYPTSQEPQNEGLIPPRPRPTPRTPGQGFGRFQPREPPRGSGFLQPGELYIPSDPTIRLGTGNPPAPKFRGMASLRRPPNAPGNIPGGTQLRGDIIRPVFPHHPLRSGGNGHRRRSQDQNLRRGSIQRVSNPVGGLDPRDPPPGFDGLHGRNASITSNHVSFAPSDQFERYSARSQSFDDSSTDDTALGPRLDAPMEFQPIRPRRRGSSFYDAPERMEFGNHLRSNFQGNIVSIGNDDIDKIGGTTGGTSSTATESWVDGERERYLRNTQRVAGGMTAIPSQDTSSDTGIVRDGEGSGGSGVDRDGRFRYDRY